MKPETIKAFTEEFKENLTKAFESAEYKDFISKTKAASDSGTFEVIISTADYDRSGESIDQKGWDFMNYKANPVVLWGHDYYSLPIGVCESLEIDGNKLIAKGRFAPEDANPFAQQVRKLYDSKIVRATSVGFIVKEMEGKVITKSELLEFSFVPVPANPYALSLSQQKTLGLDVSMLKAKGIEIVEEKAAAEGDTCTLDDGTEGIIDANGTCVAKKAAKAEGDVCVLDDGSDGVIDADGNCVAKPAEKSEKGAVSEEVDAEAMWEAKWNKIDPVCSIINALYDVYFDSETPVEDFNTLLAEVISLLQAIDTSGTVATNGIVKAKIGALKIKDLISKIGAVGEISKGSKSEETAIKSELETKVEETGVLKEGTKEFDDFQTAQKLLRSIATMTSESLEKMNKKYRERTR